MIADLLLLTPAVAAGALVQSALGFGFSLVVAPLLLMRYEPAVGIPILVFLNLAISLVLVWPLRAHLPGRRLALLAAGAVGGLPLGFLVFLRVGEPVLRGMVGVVVLAGATGIAVRRFAGTGADVREGQDREAREEAARPHRAPALLAGAAAGALTSSIGVPAPAVALYTSGAGLAAGASRALILSFYLLVFGATLLLQGATGRVGVAAWSQGALLLPGLGIGVLAGHRLGSRLDHATFHALVLLLLAVSAASLLFDALGGAP